jgi:hypothetical protein
MKSLFTKTDDIIIEKCINLVEATLERETIDLLCYILVTRFLMDLRVPTLAPAIYERDLSLEKVDKVVAKIKFCFEDNNP